eukprot:m.198578 g.198578  ORF g.198578 m.198578 type:complete len:68 (+) comp18753_c0_seq1:127-330(+)
MRSGDHCTFVRKILDLLNCIPTSFTVNCQCLESFVMKSSTITLFAKKHGNSLQRAVWRLVCPCVLTR